MEHTFACDYPEGCTCGATRWNNLARDHNILLAENVKLHQQIHDLCHDLHVKGPVTPAEFCYGCEQFQKKIFGESPIESLREERDTLQQYVKYLGKAQEMTAAFLFIHNWRYPTEFIQQGEEIRVRLAKLALKNS